MGTRVHSLDSQSVRSTENHPGFAVGICNTGGGETDSLVGLSP